VRIKKRKLLQPFPDTHPQLFDEPLYINGESTLVIADIHAPFQDKRLLTDALTMALYTDVKQVIIAGDVLHNEAFNSQNKNDPATDHAVDIAAGKAIIEVFLAHGLTVYICVGNHDEYYLKKNKVSFAQYIQEVILGNSPTNYNPNVITTERDYVLFGNDTLIGHMSGYHTEGGVYAAEIAKHKEINVIAGHDHLRGRKETENGYFGISIGCIANPDSFWYAQRRLNHFRYMQQGFAIYKQSKWYLFNEYTNEAYNGIALPFTHWYAYFERM